MRKTLLEITQSTILRKQIKTLARCLLAHIQTNDISDDIARSALTFFLERQELKSQIQSLDHQSMEP